MYWPNASKLTVTVASAPLSSWSAAAACVGTSTVKLSPARGPTPKRRSGVGVDARPSAALNGPSSDVIAVR